MKIFTRALAGVLILASAGASANSPKSRFPTVRAFEKIKKQKISGRDNVIGFKTTAEKYYVFFSPDLAEVMAYDRQLYPYLPAPAKASIEARERIVRMSASKGSLNDYQRAQKVLASFQKNDPKSVQADYDFIALVLIESYFRKNAAHAPEDAWLFRMNLRRRTYPEFEFAVISPYLARFPHGKVAREKAIALKEYLENDYRPESGDQDLPPFEVKKTLEQIRTLLK